MISDSEVGSIRFFQSLVKVDQSLFRLCLTSNFLLLIEASDQKVPLADNVWNTYLNVLL